LRILTIVSGNYNKESRGLRALRGLFNDRAKENGEIRRIAYFMVCERGRAKTNPAKPSKPVSNEEFLLIGVEQTSHQDGRIATVTLQSIGAARTGSPMMMSAESG
jgi:hypothetical protein